MRTEVEDVAAQGRERYVHLIYLGILFMQPVFGPRSAWDLPLAFALAAGFAVYYLRSYPRAKEWHAWLIVAAGFLASFFNPGASVYYVYAAFLFGIIHSGRAMWIRLLLQALTVVLQAAWLVWTRDTFFMAFSHLVSLVMIVFAGFVSTSEHERLAVNRRLREANTTIATVSKVAERERIARDMHDVLGHTLSVVVLKAELAGRLLEADPERAGAEIRDVEQLARDALRDVRAAISGYRDRGLQAELANARLAFEAAAIELHEDLDTDGLDHDTEQVLAFVLREAVTNVLRHSEASRCTIAIRRSGEAVELSVADNGRGGRLLEGQGLSGMRERLAAVDGQLELRTAGGLQLLARVPA